MSLQLARKLGWLCLLTAVSYSEIPSIAQLQITEFLASNQGLISDEDGDSSDWIEIHNPGVDPINLLNWSLTDLSTNLTKWRFPSTNLAANSYLLVFASGKDRRTPGSPLHTNFKLDSSGEFLALVAPDGTNLVSAFSPTYPPQVANISFGMPQLAGLTPIVAPGASVRWLVPKDGTLDDRWMLSEFDDSNWGEGKTGVGYETSPAEYASFIKTDLRSLMYNGGTSCYVRLPFVVSNPADFTDWRMLMQYDDGFVAYLNGQEIARRNAPELPAWNSIATANHPDAEAVIPEQFDLAAVESLIHSGTNVVAIQGLNTSASSSDLLILPVIEARPKNGSAAPAFVYFPSPTPGAANAGGVEKLGPILREVQHAPNSPQPNQPLAVTVNASPAFDPVRSVTLHYRAMFGAETGLPMFDDGAHGDGSPGDGIYGATIPTAGLAPGQMIRYFVTAQDTAGRDSRFPLFLDPADSAQYAGTMVDDASIQSRLPVVHLFVENAGASETRTGTRCSIFYLGEFYDNVLISLHGQSSSGFPKKSSNFDFNRGARFRYATNSSRVKDIKLLTNWGDKSRTHNALGYEMIREAGSVGHFAFQVRVQRNAQFHGILDMVEDGDDRWLERVGRNPNGALYKMYNSMSSASGNEKKTRRNESFGDLQALIDNLNESKPLAARVLYAYDNIDLPQTISYFVGMALISSQDHGHKNFYLYRDSDRSGEWTIFPWDIDLSWGRNWIDAGGYFTDTLYQNNVLNFYNAAQQGKPSNRLYDLIFNHPDFRQMYLRRLRTVMDTLLQAPGTPTAELRIEQRIRQMLDQMDPPEVGTSDADLDYAKWGSWGNRNQMRAEAQRILDVHLPGRRTFLFGSAAATLNGDSIPPAQDPDAGLEIGAIDFNPASGNQQDEFVELVNPNAFALDISGWKLQGGIALTFRPGTVVPANGRIFVSPNVSAFRKRAVAPHGNQNLLVQGDYAGQLSARGETLNLSNTAGRLMASTNYPGNPTAAQKFLKLTELMFHPAPPPAGSPFVPEDFEFVELKNIGLAELDLTGLRFTKGISFDFRDSKTLRLAPGQLLVLCKNAAAFASRYGPGVTVSGEYTGTLENHGETLRLEDSVGEVVFEFAYADSWQPLADGAGRSLEIRDAALSPGDPASWRASSSLGGSPGSDPLAGLVIRNFSAAANQLTLGFDSAPGRAYSIWQTSDLFAGRWELLKTVAGSVDGTETRVTIDLLPQDPQKYFQLRTDAVK